MDYGKCPVGGTLYYSRTAVIALVLTVCCLSCDRCSESPDTGAEAIATDVLTGVDEERVSTSGATLHGAVPGCVLFDDGTTRCWIAQPRSLENPQAPQRKVEIFELEKKYRSIDVDGDTFCGLDSHGHASCGHFDTEFVRIDFVLEMAIRFRHISVGLDVGCASYPFSSVVCFPVPRRDRATKSTSILIAPDINGIDSVEVGPRSACAISIGEPVQAERSPPVCWGEITSEPDAQIPQDAVKQIALGRGHACGITEDSRLHCWKVESDSTRADESRDFGQGDPPISFAKRVTAGRYHSCALSMNNAIECWGIGTGHPADIPPQGVRVDTERNDLLGLRDFGQGRSIEGNYSDISTSGATNCALSDEGKITCWGRVRSEFSILMDSD